MRLLAKKTVLITGASAGIGKSCAFEFAKHGSNIILCARRWDRLESVKAEILAKYPIKVLALQMDVSDKTAVDASIASLSPDWKDIHILVNNAGLVLGMDSIESAKQPDIHTMMNTNVYGLLNLTQAILPQMKLRNTGNIVNISSIAGTECYPNGGIYCASKHAVDAITRTLRMGTTRINSELISTSINVTSIDPGLVETEFSVIRFRGDKDKADAVYSSLTSPPLSADDVAETVAFAASRPPHVQISKMVVFPTCQAAVNCISKKQ